MNLDELVIVSNGFLNEESISGLSEYTSHDIVIRDNLGFDAGAWRDMMLDTGFKKLCQFDEIILFNDSFFGPIYPFKEMFDKMDNENVNFWGITDHGEAPNSRDMCPYGYRPRYLQTYFLAFRKNLVKSSEFQEYWANLPNYETFEELTFKHGAVLTKYFEDLGYKWKSYVESEDLEESREKAMSFHTYDMYNMVVNRSLPVLKRKAFKSPRSIHLRYNMASDISKTMRYLKNNTDYDTSLIYKYFLRTMEPNQLVDILNLVKIIPKNQAISYNTDKKVLIIAHLHYDDIWEYAFNYLKNVPKSIDILITTNSYDKKEFFEEKIANNLENNVNVIKIEPRGRDMASLLVGAFDIVKDYDYFCFMNDKKSQGKEFVTVGATFRDILWENNLASPDYINGIIKEFDDNPSLGLIVPPRVYHGPYFYSYVNNYWASFYDEVINLLDKMNINSKISKNSPPLSIGNCFWAKYDALRPLFDLNWDYEDFPEDPLPADGTVNHALERIPGYVAASKGYYTKFVMTDEYARSEIFNKSHMFKSTIRNFMTHGSGFSFMYDNGFFGFANSIKNNFKKKLLK